MAIDCRIDFDIINVRVYGGLQLNDAVRSTVSWLPSMTCAEKAIERIIDPGVCDFMKFLEDGKPAYVTYYDHARKQIRSMVRTINDLSNILEYERRVARYFGNGMRPSKYEDFSVVLERPQLNPTRVIFNEPATIVFWNDGTKTIVKCSEHDTFTKEGGFAAALAKKMYKTGGIKKILKGSVDQKEEPSLNVKDEWVKDLEDKRNGQ